ncbi:MAG TPA: hypothetical protein VF533_22950 [Solirubrobacteraceae bacterium]|jgi:hypothetical protein
MNASRGKRAFMWLSTIGFSAIGLVLLVFGPDTGARLAGAASIAFFGGGGWMWLRLSAHRPPAEPVVEIGRTDILGLSEPGLVVPARSPLRPVVGFAFMLAVSVGVLWLGVVGSNPFYLVVGVVSVVLFGVAGAGHLRRRRVPPRVVLTASGFVYEHPVSSLGVRWQAIEGVTIFSLNNVVYLGIEAPQEALVQRTGSRALMVLNRKLSGAAISVPALGLGAEVDRLLIAVDDYIADPAPLRDPERERAALAARLRAV